MIDFEEPFGPQATAQPVPLFDTNQLEEICGYRFRDQKLLNLSLTHSSFANEQFRGTSGAENNERLEFLGDAVLGLVVAQLLMERYPEASEGRLSRWRSLLVSRRALAELAQQIGLGDHLLLGRGEKRSGGAEKRSLLAAVFEAVLGALYLDGGLEPVRRFLDRWYAPWVEQVGREEHFPAGLIDRKTFLQERTQALFRKTPVYRLAESWGREHEKQFRVELLLGERLVSEGLGRSKKEAEQDAARQALEKLDPEFVAAETALTTRYEPAVEMNHPLPAMDVGEFAPRREVEP